MGMNAKKFDEGDVFEKTPYIADGNYIFAVEKTKKVEGHKGTSYVFEFKILASDNPERKAGTTVGKVLKEDSDFFISDMKKILGALLNRDPKTIKMKEDVDPIFDTGEKSVNGMRVCCEAWTGPTKKGGEFTYNEFSPYTEAA